MRALNILIGLLFITTHIAGQALQVTFTVEMTVLESGTSVPLPSAQVYLMADGELVQKQATDRLGKVLLTEIEFDKYEISVRKEGYGTLTILLELEGHDTDIRRTVHLTKVILSEDESSVESMRLDRESSSFMSTAIGKMMSAPIPASVTASSMNMVADRPAAGQVTAGEWNDLHNWQDFIDLLVEEDYSIMTERWHIVPKERYSVVVLTDRNIPLPNATVVLQNEDDHVLWQAMTDHTGKAELWSDVFRSQRDAHHITVSHSGVSKTVADLMTVGEASHTVQLKVPCVESTKVDIVFTVDATSSMSDEISYLKSELLDVIDRVQADKGELDIHTGAVFYRDHSDDYVTIQSDLTPDVLQTVEFISEQNAAGGGDYPEAVAEALQSSTALAWRADALKINFLVLDAPPREDSETLALLYEQITMAAERGIRLIPITASGINRETEFLMKFMAILTNGTYVFITDDSGIGNPHLDPVVRDYEVEKLNDLMVRLITEMSSITACDATWSRETTLDLSVYPNPCTQYVTVSTSTVPDRIDITSSTGMVVHTVIPTAAETRVELTELVSGVYTVYITAGTETRSRKLLVVR